MYLLMKIYPRIMDGIMLFWAIFNRFLKVAESLIFIQFGYGHTEYD